MSINPQDIGTRDLHGVQRVADIGPLPDDPGSNKPYTLSWTGTQLDYVETTQHGVTWRKTLTWAGGVLTGVSVWVQQ